MRIGAIQNFNIGSIGTYRSKLSERVYPQSTIQADSFQKSSSVSFGTRFETLFPSAFFRKILKEGVSCAYTNIPLIPKEDFRVLEALEGLNVPIHLDLAYLNKYKPNLYSMEQRVLKFLNAESKKHPNRTIAELMIAKCQSAEKTMRVKQVENLNKLIVEARALPKEDFSSLRFFAMDYVKRLTSQNPQGIILDPKKLSALVKDMNIKDKKLEKTLLKRIDKIPSEENSLDAYIYERVKLAQGTELSQREKEQLSHKISLNILSPSVASDEHFYPQALYRAEESSGKHKGEPFRVSFLTSKYMNEIKRDMKPDDFIEACEFDVPLNLQEHINRLTEIHSKWRAEHKSKDADKLAQYILTLKLEAEKRSKYVTLDISALEKMLGAEKLKDYTGLIKGFLDINV
jgi:hypothetical protein